MKIVPGILTDSVTDLQAKVEAIRYSELIDTLHIDIIDGNYADNITITPLDLTVTDFEPMKIDFHILTDEPMDYVYEAMTIKEYLPVRRMIGQIERMSHQADFIQEVKLQGWEPALALDLYTPLESIEEESWNDIKCILLMSTEGGFSGQKLNFHIFEKLKELREMFPDHNRMQVMIDGGVKPDNALSLINAGADELAPTSAIWSHHDPLLAIEEFYRLLQQNSLS
jgi:ribulose-phosphate 3-epimerase